jgi:DNA polymerase-3 subunit delta
MARARKRSAASSAATLSGVLRQIESGWPPGLTVLTGEDLYHLDRAQHALIDHLVPPESSEFGLTVYGEERVDVATVVAASRSVGMFADRRVVLVRNGASLSGEADTLVTFAKQPPAASHLIVRAEKLDRRRKLHQALAGAGCLLEFPAIDPREASRLAPQVTTLAGEKGLQIDRTAAALLAEVCTGDFYRIDTELEKMRAWSGGDGKPITPAVLREVACGSAALSGWEVASALTRADRAAALGALQRLLDAGDEPLRVLGGLAYRARSIVQARAMMERGVPATRAVAAARIWGESPADVAAGISRYTLKQVLGFAASLLEADRTLKSRGLAPRAVLGELLERMIPDDRTAK